LRQTGCGGGVAGIRKGKGEEKTRVGIRFRKQ